MGFSLLKAILSIYIVNRYADSLSTTVDLDQVHFLLREARNVCVPIADLLLRKSPSQSLLVIVAATGYLATGL